MCRVCVSAGSAVRLWCGSQFTVCLVTGETLINTHLSNGTQTGIHTHTHTSITFLCKWARGVCLGLNISVFKDSLLCVDGCQGSRQSHPSSLSSE